MNGVVNVAWQDVQHPPSLARVTLHAPSSTRRAVIGAVFVLLYAYSGQWCYETAGEPLAMAKLEIAKQEAAKNASLALKQNATSSKNASAAALNLNTEDLLQELAEIEAEPHHSANESAVPLPNATSPKPLPSQYLPNAWAGALLFFVVVANALFFLMGHWMVWFKCATLYQPTESVTEGVYAHVHTHAHKGKAGLCELTRSTEKPHRLTFQFQRQNYEHLAHEEEMESAAELGITGLGEHNGYVRVMQ